MKTIIAIGGGELRTKTTAQIDRYIASKAKTHAGDKRAYGLFLGTASHDSMPYFNTFRKTYTSDFDIKADCALTVYGEMNYEKIRDKFLKADMIYIGGGDTLFMLNHLRDNGYLDLVLDAYNRGVIMCGLSAGAIFWFDKMYTDSKAILSDADYSIASGLGVLGGVCTPHYNERKVDFDETFLKNGFSEALAIENDCAVEFIDRKMVGAISSGGEAFILRNNNNTIEKYQIEKIKSV